MLVPETSRRLLCFRGVLEGRSVIERCEGKSLGPHTRTVLPSVLTAHLTTAQLDVECVGNSVRLCS
jgi:hypothetical protein